MVACTPTQLFGAAALCVSAFAPCAHGSGLKTNPVSIVAEETRLNHEHPAFGAGIPNEVAAYVVEEQEIIDVSGKTTTTTRTRSRALEASSMDMMRLEDHFKTKMETSLKTLQGASFMQATYGQVPWPSSYWPIYEDGINARWDAQQPSPADKYAMAFGLNVEQFAYTISQNSGILSQSHRRACSETRDCDSLKDGSSCGKRAGEAKGYCIPRWFGICHAWAPVAILEKEPVCAVQRGNVTFQVFDIKALITQLYDGAEMEVVFTGARYNGADEPADLDEFGRYKDDARRDLGPGFFHIAMTNIMAKFKQSLILDVTAGAAVWNQPVRSFKVLELKEVDVKQASQQYFKSTKYPFNSAMKHLAFAKTQVSWIVEGVEDGPLVSNGRVDAYTHSATYEYLLELDGNRNIIGGEWVGKSRYDHPDFLWFPKGKPAANVVTSVGIKYTDITQLLEDSIKCAPTTPVPTTAAPVTTAPVTTMPSTDTPITTPVACRTRAGGSCGNALIGARCCPAGGSCGNALIGARCCPAGSYCQPRYPWYYQCLAVPDKCATQQVNVDFFGEDLKTIFGVGASECCNHCAQTDKCKAYTFINYNGFSSSLCYLKTGSGKPRFKAGAVSALVTDTHHLE